MSRSDSFRCAACRSKKNRCDVCRAARAAYRRSLRAAKREAGICTECSRKASVGVFCDEHQAANLERVVRSREPRRAQAGRLARSR